MMAGNAVVRPRQAVFCALRRPADGVFHLYIALAADTPLKIFLILPDVVQQPEIARIRFFAPQSGKSEHKVPPPLPHGLGSSAIVLSENLLLNVPNISPFFPPRFYVLIISHKTGIRSPVYKNFLKIFCHSPFSRKDVHFRPSETDSLDTAAVFRESPPARTEALPFLRQQLRSLRKLFHPAEAAPRSRQPFDFDIYIQL